ncbi:MAG: hypothetical protein AVDCRST_MAG88-3898, partial [uncultured Thermomicrobiales bacterium]
EFLLARPEVDRDRVGIRGDDLALLVAARRAGFRALDLSGLQFYRLLEACARTEAYPIEEVNDWLRGHPGEREAVVRTLALFDPLAHAPRVRATTLLSTDAPGTLAGPDWLEPLRDALGGPVEQYALTHEGATDHDWIDAWTAARLGVAPRPRLWRIEA